MQSGVGGGLSTLWSNATGGMTIGNTVGADKLATAIWETMFNSIDG